LQLWRRELQQAMGAERKKLALETCKAVGLVMDKLEERNEMSETASCDPREQACAVACGDRQWIRECPRKRSFEKGTRAGDLLAGG